MSSPTTLLFDVDETLVRAPTANKQRLAAAFAAVGMEPFCTIEELWEVLPRVDGESHDELKVACFRTLAEEKGYSVEAAEQVAHTVALSDASAVEPVDAAREVLTTLQERGYTVGVVTNGPEPLQRAKLRRVALDEVFETLVFGRPKRGLKPALAPFETALAALETAPGDAVTIGNSYPADIEPAHALGMTTVWFPRSPDDHQAAPKADHVIQSLRPLLAEPWRQ